MDGPQSGLGSDAVAFGDGIEDDRLILSGGQRVSIAVADRYLVTL